MRWRRGEGAIFCHFLASSLRDQVLGVVDAFKDLVMENLVHKLNPDAWKQSDEIPQKQGLCMVVFQ